MSSHWSPNSNPVPCGFPCLTPFHICLLTVRTPDHNIIKILYIHLLSLPVYPTVLELLIHNITKNTNVLSRTENFCLLLTLFLECFYHNHLESFLKPFLLIQGYLCKDHWYSFMWRSLLFDKHKKNYTACKFSTGYNFML